jgi:hypothetical protein
MKRIVIIGCLAAAAAFSMGFRPTSLSLALVTRTIDDVTRKSPAASWVRAANGDVLLAGDQVKTGKKSLAILKFTDRSIIRLREQSELTVTADGNRGSLIKTLNLGGGSFGFDVKKQQNERFRLTSPTSVASIRGTQGKLASGNGNDTLVVLEGLVNLRNNVSNHDTDVAAGYIGFSSQDGSLSVRQASPDELADASSAALGGSNNELKLEFQDPKGIKRELKLHYKK